MLTFVNDKKPNMEKKSDMAYSASLFAPMLSLFPRSSFRKFRGDRYAKSFSCWDQLVALLFCHLGNAHSLREICGGLATTLGKLSHLGVNSVPKRTALAHANSEGSWHIFQHLFYALLQQAHDNAPRNRKFHFKNKLYSLDDSVIELYAPIFDWAQFRQTKGTVKLHLLWDHDGYLPTFACITQGKTHEIKPPVFRYSRIRYSVLLGSNDSDSMLTETLIRDCIALQRTLSVA